MQQLRHSFQSPAARVRTFGLNGLRFHPLLSRQLSPPSSRTTNMTITNQTLVESFGKLPKKAFFPTSRQKTAPGPLTYQDAELLVRNTLLCMWFLLSLPYPTSSQLLRRALSTLTALVATRLH